MKIKFLCATCLLILAVNSCKKEGLNAESKDKSMRQFVSSLPDHWNGEFFEAPFDSLPIPYGVDTPLYIVKYTNSVESFSIYNTPTFPSLFLYYYDISQKGKIEKIIFESIYLSCCTPIFYGENENYFVITSPCYVNSGCFYAEANDLIRPLHLVLQNNFTTMDTFFLE